MGTSEVRYPLCSITATVAGPRARLAGKHRSGSNPTSLRVLRYPCGSTGVVHGRGITVWLIVAALFLWASSGSSQSVDTSRTAKGGVTHVATQTGMTVYIGGDFSRVGSVASGGAPVNSESGKAVRPFPKVNGHVYAAVSDGSGGWFVGGNFRAIAGRRPNALAHIMRDGSVAAWDPHVSPPPGGPSDVTALAVSGNTVYFGGYFAKIGGQNRPGIGAVDATTGAATEWNPVLTADEARVDAIAVSGNTVYVGGRFAKIGGQARSGIAALDATTGAATAWNPNATGDDSRVRGLVVSGRTVYVGGSFTNIGGQPRKGIASLDVSTGVASGWNPSADGEVGALAVSGNTIYVGGHFSHIGGQPRTDLAALDATTAAATEWNPDPGGDIHALAVSGNVIYAGGEFRKMGGKPRHYVAALDVATGIVTDWNPAAGGSPLSLDTGRIVRTIAVAPVQFGPTEAPR